MYVPNPPGSNDVLKKLTEGIKSGEDVLRELRRGSLKDNYGQVDESM